MRKDLPFGRFELSDIKNEIEEMLFMNYKVKKTAGAASALALSALMAASAFGSVTASAAATVKPIGEINISDDQGNKQVWVNGGFHDVNDCYYVNGKYYLKGTVGSSSTYQEYTDGTVYINGYTYRMSDCTYANGRYYAPSSATPTYGYNNRYGYYYNNSNYVYYNGYYYLKNECSYDSKTGTYTPTPGATKYYDYYTNGYYNGYYYGYIYNYQEYDTFVVVNGTRYNKSDCTYYNGKYYPYGYTASNGYGYGYYYNGNYYNSYYAYLNAIYNYNGIIYNSTSSSVSKTDPFIYGNEKKKGWSTVINTILNAKINSDIKIDMNETYSLTKKFMSAAATKNVNITLVMPNGAVWEFNGKDIDKDYVSNVNLAVKYNTNKIPASLKSQASKGASSYSEITIGQDSAYLGFEGTVSIKFNKSNAFANAKLYRYDSSRNVLVLVDETIIGSDGTASFDVVNSGTYAIVIAK